MNAVELKLCRTLTEWGMTADNIVRYTASFAYMFDGIPCFKTGCNRIHWRMERGRKGCTPSLSSIFSFSSSFWEKWPK